MTSRDVYNLFKDFKDNDFKHLKRVVYIILIVVALMSLDHATNAAFMAKIKWLLSLFGII